MKSAINLIAIYILANLCLLSTPAFCEEAVSANDLEKALMRYILSYEALQKARQTPSQQSQLPTFRKNYDEAYSQYLVLLEKDDLYNPTDENKPNDPAGLYNQKMGTNEENFQLWETVDTSSEREKVSEAVENGNNPDDVLEVVEAQIPEQGYSKSGVDENEDDGDDTPSTIIFQANQTKCSHERGHKPHRCKSDFGKCKKCGLPWY